MHVLWYLDTIKRWFQDTTLRYVQSFLMFMSFNCKYRKPKTIFKSFNSHVYPCLFGHPVQFKATAITFWKAVQA